MKVITLNEKITVMQAFKEGKTIQINDGNGNWYDAASEPSWNWDNYEYRIKPETEYRQYSSADEFISDSRRFGPFLHNKQNGSWHAIVEVSKKFIDDKNFLEVVYLSYGGNIVCYTMCDLYNYFEWGGREFRPCGARI